MTCRSEGSLSPWSWSKAVVAGTKRTIQAAGEGVYPRRSPSFRLAREPLPVALEELPVARVELGIGGEFSLPRVGLGAVRGLVDAVPRAHLREGRGRRRDLDGERGELLEREARVTVV